MTAFPSNGDMRTLRSYMGLDNVTSSFRDFFSHINIWNKNKPAKSSNYGINATNFSSLASLANCYNSNSNGWTLNALADIDKDLRDFIGYDHSLGAPLSGLSVDASHADNSSDGYFTLSIEFYASTSARVSIADVVGSSCKLGVYLVGKSTSATFSFTSSSTIGSSGTLSLQVPTTNRNAEEYWVYPYLANSNGTIFYTLPTVGRTQIEIDQYVPPAPYVTGLLFTGYTGAIQVGQSFTLAVYEQFSNGTTGSTNIANVNNWVESSYQNNFTLSGTGTFKGTVVGSGIEIKYRYNGTDYIACHATVEAVPVTLSYITISGSRDIGFGEYFDLAVTAHYSDGSSADVTNSVTWSINTPNVLSRNGCRFTGSGVGSTTITANYGGKNATTSSITVSKLVTSVTLSSSELEITDDGTWVSLPTATVHYNDNSTDNDVTWESLSNAVSIINTTKKIKGLSQAADVRVRAHANANRSKWAMLIVQVVAAPVTLQSITLNHSAYTIQVNVSTVTLIATAHYSDGTSTQLSSSNVTWQVESGSSYMSVNSNGVVSPVAAGSGKIKATYQGCVVRCNITVAAAPAQDVAITNAYIYMDGSNISSNEIRVSVGDNVELNAVFTPVNATIASYTWTTTARRIASITDATTDSPTINCIAAGKATITLKIIDTLNNEKSKKITVNVREDAI